jgi:hypothetical protein
MGSVVYGLCAITSAACAALLLSAYRRQPVRLLLWSGLCFCGLALNNSLLFADFILTPRDLSLYRSASAAASVLLLLLGLIWDQGERGGR